MKPISARSHTTALGLILTCYAAARVLQVCTGPVPRTSLVAMDVLSALAFALVDGARHYGLRGISIFAVICALLGNAMENLGLATGFPFGHYRFLEVMGPKLFAVPVLLGLAYIGMAWVSWILARILLGRLPRRPLVRILAMPLIASFIMVAWDLAQDPVWSTFLHAWVWRDGGPWFGVPLSNYGGWFLTVFLIYMFFALYLHRAHTPIAGNAPPMAPAVVFYALCAAGNVLQILTTPRSPIVRDAAGKPWLAMNILYASALVSIFVMGAFVALAAVRLLDRATD